MRRGLDTAEGSTSRDAASRDAVSGAAARPLRSTSRGEGASGDQRNRRSRRPRRCRQGLEDAGHRGLIVRGRDEPGLEHRGGK